MKHNALPLGYAFLLMITYSRCEDFLNMERTVCFRFSDCCFFFSSNLLKESAPTGASPDLKQAAWLSVKQGEVATRVWWHGMNFHCTIHQGMLTHFILPKCCYLYIIADWYQHLEHLQFCAKPKPRYYINVICTICSQAQR